MKTIARLCAVIGLAAALSACAAATDTNNLSQLNATYDGLIDKLGSGVSDGLAVPPAPGADPAGMAREGLQAQFGALAQDAEALGGTAADPATRVAAYRLAGLAAWQHGASDPLIAQAQSDGLAVCAKLGAGPAGAPRDCAILRWLMILAAYQEVALGMNGLSDPTPDHLKAIQAQWLSRIGALATAETSAWSDASSGSPPYAGIGPSTLQYFRGVTFVSACLVDIAHRKANVVALMNAPVPDGYLQTVTTVEGQFLPVLKAANLVTDKSATSWFGSPDMNCASTLGGAAPSVMRSK